MLSIIFFINYVQLIRNVRPQYVSNLQSFPDLILDTKEYLAERNQMVLQFLNGCCNTNYEDQTNTATLFAIAVTVEMIYFIRNFNLVLPHCFVVNLLQSFVSGSKTISTVNGKVTPGASYSTYKKWLNVKGDKVLICPDGDQVTYFDNIGKYISKSYRVLSQKYIQPDIVTTTLHIRPGEQQLQKMTNINQETAGSLQLMKKMCIS